MMGRFWDGEMEGASVVNPGVPIGKAYRVYDAALAQLPEDALVDVLQSRDCLLACNVVRDFGLPPSIAA